MSNNNLLLKVFICSVSIASLTGCLNTKKDYVVITGSQPTMPKEQALAQCEYNVSKEFSEQRSRALEEARADAASQPTSYQLNSRISCSSMGITTNCTSYGTATPQNGFANGRIMGVQTGSSLRKVLLKGEKIKNCMARMGYREIEITSQY